VFSSVQLCRFVASSWLVFFGTAICSSAVTLSKNTGQYNTLHIEFILTWSNWWVVSGISGFCICQQHRIVYCWTSYTPRSIQRRNESWKT